MKVSVYLITYNRQALLERAILSVINQTYKNIELIVVDDCSHDETESFLKSKYKEYNELIDFKFYINSKNKGACYSRNKAIKLSSGRFVTGLDDDDYFSPSRIDNFIKHWSNKNINSVCLFSNYHVLSKSSFLTTKLERIVNKKDLLMINCIGNQIFIERELLLTVGGFSENMPAWQDLECWYRLLDFGTAENIIDATYVVDISHSHERISLGGLSKIKKAYSIMCFLNCLTIVDKHILKSQILRYRFNFFIYVSCLIIAFIKMDLAVFKQLHKNLIKGILSNNIYSYFKKKITQLQSFK